MNIEDVFSSRLRIKILKILALTGELNVSEIARRLGVNYKTTRKHLEVLENENMIKHKLFGRIRLYKLNKRSPKTEAIQTLIQIWDHADNQ
ncbi:MAG: winged helix-turn-helix domain-containing protein [Candidatus Bathyarchaeota archaeon]|jgi:DNA-binding transcriptional ArsR family regulator